MTLNQRSGISLVPQGLMNTFPTKVCTYGDSILAQAHDGSDATPDTNPGSLNARSRGVMGMLNALMGQPFHHPVQWIGANATDFEIEGYDAGISGHTISECITDVGRVTKLGADACLLLVGTNDIRSATTSLANMKIQYEQLVDLIIDSGTAVWGLPVMPRNAVDGSSDWTTSERLVHLSFNSWLRDFDRIKNGFTLFDWYSALVDHTTGDAITGYTSDSVHFSVQGATAGARFIMSKLSQPIPTHRSFPYFSSVVDFHDATNNITGNLFSPAAFTGTGGTKDTGITGTVPDTINVDNEDTVNLSAVMSVISAPTDVDQYGGNWMRFAITSGGGGSGEKFIRIQRISSSIAVPSGTTDKWFKGGAFIKIDTPSIDDLLIGVYVQLKKYYSELKYYFVEG